jgi:hypothetical protein
MACRCRIGRRGRHRVVHRCRQMCAVVGIVGMREYVGVRVFNASSVLRFGSRTLGGAFANGRIARSSHAHPSAT